ncbi:MAG: lycopene beta-cyclase [Saprospiraceae bacterium]|jgi:lycopene beta-cyclase
MKSEMHFDYIILGSGAAGLSLAHRMANDCYFDNKSIAIIDKEEKNKNDRTWCYWEIGEGYFDSIVKKKWDEIQFYSKTLDKRQNVNPYQYKMIAGLDFYDYTIPFIEQKENFTFIYDTIESVDESNVKAIVHTSKESYSADQVFKSYPSVSKVNQEEHMYVDQHFKGYFIETPKPTFDPSCATFMDFRIDQKGDARFLYVLPESETKALVEVALFSNNLLSQKDYNLILTDYIVDFLDISNYDILEEEFGIIPMTTYPFKNHNTEHVFHIGTGGGLVKPSSGFAFSRIQKHSDQLINCIKDNSPLSNSYHGLHGRHTFYDKVMLHAMIENGVSGEDIFTDLFSKKTASQIFKFLDHETSFLEDIGIFSAPPMLPFTKSFFSVLGK